MSVFEKARHTTKPTAPCAGCGDASDVDCWQQRLCIDCWSAWLKEPKFMAGEVWASLPNPAPVEALERAYTQRTQAWVTQRRAGIAASRGAPKAAIKTETTKGSP